MIKPMTKARAAFLADLEDGADSYGTVANDAGDRLNDRLVKPNTVNVVRGFSGHYTIAEVQMILRDMILLQQAVNKEG